MVKQNNHASYIILAIKAIHYAFSIGSFYIFFLLFRYGRLTDIEVVGFRYNYLVSVGYGILLAFFNRTYNSFLFGFSRIRSLVFAQILSQFFSLGLIYSIVSIGWGRLADFRLLITLLPLQMVFDIIWSYYSNGFYYKMYGKRKTLMIYRNEIDKRRFGSIHGKPTERMYVISKEIQYDGSFSDLKDRLSGYDAIFVSGINSSCRNGILKYCKEKNIPGYFLPHVGDTIMQAAKHVKAFDSPVLYVSRKELTAEYAIIKRLFDIISSGIALIVLSPIFLITSLSIKLFDNGPILYKQTRLTKNGKEFKILKFRSMRVDAEKDGVARLSAGEKDDRITPVGKIIRKFRLDELPQLWNIFVGDMSVVGPRPERPEIAEQYYNKMPDFRLRLQVKAGLTGYAQVYGKYNTAPYEKLEFDLLYINNMSILTDLQLCFATFAILFDKNSTDGVEGLTADYDSPSPKQDGNGDVGTF